MSHPVNQLFYVLGVLFLFLILMEAINLIAIQPRSRKTVATVTKIRLRRRQPPCRTFFRETEKKKEYGLCYL